jgi:hypothetical protein
MCVCVGGGGGAIMDSLCCVCRSFCPSVCLHFRVRSINPIPIEGFSSNLAQMFTSARGSAEHVLPMCQLKVTIEGQISNNQILDSRSCPLCKSYTNWKIFLQQWLKCSPQQGDVQNPCHPFAGLWSRSHLKVKNWLRKILLNFNMFWIFLKLEKVFAWNLKYIWSVTMKICRSSFITLYGILTKLCPFLSLQIYIQSNIRQYVVSAL